MATEIVYGYFPGGDPRDFTPDPDCSTEAERAAHKAACDRWNAGDETPVPRVGFERFDDAGRLVARGCGSPFGLGMYSVDLGDYEPSEPEPVDMISWDVCEIVDWTCTCGRTLFTEPAEHGEDCDFPLVLPIIERLKNGPRAA